MCLHLSRCKVQTKVVVEVEIGRDELDEPITVYALEQITRYFFEGDECE